MATKMVASSTNYINFATLFFLSVAIGHRYPQAKKQKQ